MAKKDFKKNTAELFISAADEPQEALQQTQECLTIPKGYKLVKETNWEWEDVTFNEDRVLHANRCPHCKHERLYGGRYCPNCGRRLLPNPEDDFVDHDFWAMRRIYTCMECGNEQDTPTLYCMTCGQRMENGALEPSEKFIDRTIL